MPPLAAGVPTCGTHRDFVQQQRWQSRESTGDKAAADDSMTDQAKLKASFGEVRMQPAALNCCSCTVHGPDFRIQGLAMSSRQDDILVGAEGTAGGLQVLAANMRYQSSDGFKFKKVRSAPG